MEIPKKKESTPHQEESISELQDLKKEIVEQEKRSMESLTESELEKYGAIASERFSGSEEEQAALEKFHKGIKNYVRKHPKGAGRDLLRSQQLATNDIVRKSGTTRITAQDSELFDQAAKAIPLVLRGKESSPNVFRITPSEEPNILAPTKEDGYFAALDKVSDNPVKIDFPERKDDTLQPLSDADAKKLAKTISEEAIKTGGKLMNLDSFRYASQLRNKTVVPAYLNFLEEVLKENNFDPKEVDKNIAQAKSTLRRITKES